MDEIMEMRKAELIRLYERLAETEMNTQDYENVEFAIMKLEGAINDREKIDNSQVEAKKEQKFKLLTFAGELILTPLIGLGVNRSFAKLVSKLENDTPLNSAAGRQISKLFRWKNK